MKRRPLPFRDLLRSVLPVHRLPAHAQDRVQEALRSGDPNEIEAAALEALGRLEAEGHLRFVEEVVRGEEKFRRYRDLTSGNTISVRLPITEEDEGVYKIPLPIQKWKGNTSLEKIRLLFGLYNQILTQDSQVLSSPREILGQLTATTLKALGSDAVTYWSRPGSAESPLDEISAPAYDEELALDWVLDKRHLAYYPDLPAQIDPDTGRLDRRYQSLVMLPIGSPGQSVQGVLHVWSTRDHFFDEDRLGLLSLVSEIAGDLFRRSEILGNLVFVDAATGIYNRSFFNLQLENEIARAKRESQTFALVIADIDDFKKFNNRYGYEGGNQVLATAAQVLRNGLRPFDTVARWGGEEFGLILTPPVTLEHAQTACERLRNAAALSRFTLTGLEGESLSAQLTISLGGAM